MGNGRWTMETLSIHRPFTIVHLYLDESNARGTFDEFVEDEKMGQAHCCPRQDLTSTFLLVTH
jgi:hypothetical protein